MKGAELKALRRKVQIVFQDPYASLNPRMKVEDIVSEGIRIHKLIESPEERRARVAQLLELVGLERAHLRPASPQRSPAANDSASGSPGPLPWTPSSSSATSRSHPWTCPFRRRSSTCSATCSSSCISPCSSSRTTWQRFDISVTTLS